jgi:hypothetical protein
VETADPSQTVWGESDPASFRDRSARVYHRNGRVLRGLSPSALSNWLRLEGSAFFPRLVAEGRVVRTRRLDAAAAAHAHQPDEWAGLLEHERIPFVSYPYEWSFGMLRDAALLHLDLMLAALAEGFILKDASPYNVQWVGSRPVFIDIPSFEPLAPGEPWVGYRQFCELFLYPLMLRAYKDVPFQPWLRGHIDGIEPEQCLRLMSARDLSRPGVLAHVYLQARLQALYGQGDRDIRSDLRRAGFDPSLITANVRRLKKLVSRLRWKASASTWSEYARQCPSYSDAELAEKVAFVESAVSAQASRRWRLAWDLGANTGMFSRICAEQADYTVALDADELAVERLYQHAREANEANGTLLPLVMNLADPSPNLGWRGLERQALVRRQAPDLVLCLALIHHLVIGANIPLPELLVWLRDLGGALVIEFIAKKDPMVQRILRNRVDQYADYDQELFERLLTEKFEVARRCTLASGNRMLYFATPRPA